jgi:hypothetical protein
VSRDAMHSTLDTEPISYSDKSVLQTPRQVLVTRRVKTELAYRLHKNRKSPALLLVLVHLLLLKSHNSNSVHTSQRTHYVSITKPVTLSLSKILAVYCENHQSITHSLMELSPS